MTHNNKQITYNNKQDISLLSHLSDFVKLRRNFSFWSLGFYIEVMQVTSQALVRWKLIHFGRKEVLRNIYIIILSLLLSWYYNLL